MSTVSIMPGIEVRAPQRQETNSGFVGSPNFMPIAASVFCNAAATSSRSDWGNCRPSCEIDRAELGADREAGRDRQTELGHLGEVCPLAAERILHRCVAFGSLRAEE